METFDDALDKDIEGISLNSGRFINAITVDLDGDAADNWDWDAAGLPPPSMSVCNGSGRKKGRHDTWFLASPVVIGERARVKPWYYSRIVRRGMTLAMNGDLFFNNRITKNPWHSKFRTVTPLNWSSDYIQAYELNDLADGLDLDHASVSIKAERSAYIAIDPEARNSSLSRVAGIYAIKLARAGRLKDQIIWTFLDAENSRLECPLSQTELRGICRSAVKWAGSILPATGKTVLALPPTMPIRQRQQLAAKHTAAIRVARSWGPEIAARLSAGDKRAAIAADLGISKEAVKQAARRARRRAEGAD